MITEHQQGTDTAQAPVITPSRARFQGEPRFLDSGCAVAGLVPGGSPVPGGDCGSARPAPSLPGIRPSGVPAAGLPGDLRHSRGRLSGKPAGPWNRLTRASSSSPVPCRPGLRCPVAARAKSRNPIRLRCRDLGITGPKRRRSPADVPGSGANSVLLAAGRPHGCGSAGAPAPAMSHRRGPARQASGRTGPGRTSHPGTRPPTSRNSRQLAHVP